MKTITIKYYPLFTHNGPEQVTADFRMCHAYPSEVGKETDFNVAFASGLYKLREALNNRYDAEHKTELDAIKALASDTISDDPEDDYDESMTLYDAYQTRRAAAVDAIINDNDEFRREWNAMFAAENFPAHHYFMSSEIVTIKDGAELTKYEQAVIDRGLVDPAELTENPLVMDMLLKGCAAQIEAQEKK